MGVTLRCFKGGRKNIFRREIICEVQDDIVPVLRAKREMQIENVMKSTVDMHGDLQGIAGKSLQEIEGLEFPALEDADRKSVKE